MYSPRYKLLYVSYNQAQGCELIGYTYPITRFKVANVLVIQIVMYLQSEVPRLRFLDSLKGEYIAESF